MPDDSKELNLEQLLRTLKEFEDRFAGPFIPNQLFCSWARFGWLREQLPPPVETLGPWGIPVEVNPWLPDNVIVLHDKRTGKCQVLYLDTGEILELDLPLFPVDRNHEGG